MAKTKIKYKTRMVCPECGWTSRVVVQKDGTFKCYHCGHVGEKKEFEIKVKT